MPLLSLTYGEGKSPAEVNGAGCGGAWLAPGSGLLDSHRAQEWSG